MGQTDNRADDRGIAKLCFDIQDEGLRDFDVIGGKAAQIVKRGVARPEIVDRKFNADLSKPDQNIIMFARGDH